MSGKGSNIGDLLTGGEAAGTQAQSAIFLQLLTKIANNMPTVPISAGQYPGTTTNDNAAAGNIGEFISSGVARSATTGLTTNTPLDIASISLTPGDWDVWGMVGVNAAAGTVFSELAGWISPASATLPTLPNGGAYANIFLGSNTSAAPATPVGKTRISLAATTTIYLSTLAQFTVSTAGVYGFIGARRAR